MQKIWTAALILLLAGSTAATQIESKIAGSCPADYEPTISMAAPNDTYSNPGPPGMYQYNLCISGIEKTQTANSCDKNAGFYLSSNGTDAHLSKFSSYNIPVCTGQMVTSIRDSCLSNQTSLFSISGEDNAHVASPDIFNKEVCGYFEKPKNITLEVEFNLSSSDNVYVDGQKAAETEFRLAEFPYIVSEGSNHVSGIVADDMIRVERKLEQDNRLIMERESGEFIIPFTRGDHEEIEEHQQQILGNSFLNQVEPSFGFFIPEHNTITASLGSNATIESDISLGKGSSTLKLTKTGDNKIKIYTE